MLPLKIIPFFVCVVLAIAAAAEAGPWKTKVCQPDETALIKSVTRCSETSGFVLTLHSDENVIQACREDGRVQLVCGPGGGLTRIKAFRNWLQELKDFENRCGAGGGTFAYAQPDQAEPNSEFFCTLPVIVTGSSSLEDPTCDYRSSCPPVQVACHYPCNASALAQQPREDDLSVAQLQKSR